MDRFTITTQIAGKQVEIQFDLKKMPGETGPSYMISIDGLFSGYITKDKAGCYVKMLNSEILEDYMAVINEKLGKSIVKLSQ